MKSKNTIIKISTTLFFILLINFVGQKIYKRIDLTQDQRYTLSKETKSLLERIEKPLNIKVYLQGEFPSEFKRLQSETAQFLDELNAINKQVKFRFIDPLSNAKELVNKGMQPSRLTVQEGGKVSEAVIFPWASISYDGREENVSLLVSASAPSQEQQLQNSIENLEYEFAHAFAKVLEEKSKKVAVLKGNGELSDLQLYSFLSKLGDYYHLGAFTLDSIEQNPQRTLDLLRDYDLAIIAKPTETFSEEEKYALDQYVMQGGKSMWFIDNIHAEMDSLMSTGNSLAYNRDLGLTDLFFQYGVRINYNISKDLYSSTIRLASGNTGNQVQYQDFLWPYFPLVFPSPTHPISKNLDPILLRFPSSIDTLKNGLSKTVLLHSSPRSKIIGTPTNVALAEIAEEQDENQFNDPMIPFGVLIEGNFKSAYASRVKPFSYPEALEISSANKMLVVSDGDLLSNEVYQGEPLPLDKDKWTNQPYGNLEFLLNTAKYLLDDSGVIKLRAKSLQLQFLDKQRAYEERGYWQLVNLLIPLLLLFAFGMSFRFLRIKKYG